jgi:diaminohydroxyphosphoribosylaminopyrimidine deaminase/5-amino-6-(5-phosphoribosylamino)uracil reductase
MGAQWVAPNPMVGAVLVYRDRIIGEGYHTAYGKPHAEVECINSVAAHNRSLIKDSVLYVSLEPCAHYGKTPPCVQLILKHEIKNVVIGSRDPFDQVNGKGIEQLLAAGVAVTVGVLEQECNWLNRRFFTFHTQKRPYIVLKWAQSADGYIGSRSVGNLPISQPITRRLVHRWRSEESSIMVGSGTAELDNPALTNRLWYGKNPTRLVLDRSGRLPSNLRLFDGSVPTVLFTKNQNDSIFNSDVKVAVHSTSLPAILKNLYSQNVQSVLIEGGAALLAHCMEESIWDEAYCITATQLQLGEGVQIGASISKPAFFTEQLGTDSIAYFRNDNPFNFS